MYQPNYRPNLKKKITPSEILLNLEKEETEVQQDTDNLLEIQEDEKQEVNSISNSWKIEQAERQNRTATLIEVEEDQAEGAELGSQPDIPNPSSIMANYKLIGITKVKQFNHLKNLLPPDFEKPWQYGNSPINLGGILVEIETQKIGLVLADISANNRVAEIISLVVLPKYSYDQIGAKLIHCLETSLPKLNCDRLILNKEALAIKNKAQTYI